jgi:uncharacterized protein YbaP (TraB family)
MIKWTAAALFALSAAANAAAPAPSPTLPDAKPAIWIVSDQDTTIYLFGTFHALDGKSQWFNDEVKTAFDASDQLVLETLVPDPSAITPANKPPLTMPSRKQARAIPVAPSASFLATTRLAISAGKSQGMKVDNGADHVLRHAAEAAGKEVDGLESFQFQLDMFSRLAQPAAQAPKAGEPVQPMASLSTVMTQLQAAWKKGDQAAFRDMLATMREASPDIYRQMFVERNVRWANWIAERIRKPGTVFVAVGAGHLAGPDSVQSRLTELGIQPIRVN